MAKRLYNSNIGRFIRTVRHLKFRQIYYRVYYTLRKYWQNKSDLGQSLPKPKSSVYPSIKFPSFSQTFYEGNNTFRFLNQLKSFPNGIDWNFMGHGKLWNYNLLYFDYLNQSELSDAKNVKLIRDFINKFDSITLVSDPYPISLRCINWIKFINNQEKSYTEIEQAIYQQYFILLNNIEYHLMGNHIMENGCSLLFGGIYFSDDELREKGRKILINELNEQILEDGGHFERSPMYHQILLYRLMDCYNILAVDFRKDETFKKFLKQVIERMLGWLQMVTFNDGSVPRVNDTVSGIAPRSNQLFGYARQLEIELPTVVLSESGYRMIKKNNFEWFIDVGEIGPDYIPGHAHSDTLSFVLHINECPFIVDTGISTYEESERRITERSTAAHNTVIVNGEEQTEVWKSFRVGRRAHITDLNEGSNFITAEHDGFKHVGIRHTRKFEWNKNKLHINDLISGKVDADVNAVAYFHFHPSVRVKKTENGVIANKGRLIFDGYNHFRISTYHFAEEFNKLKSALVVEVHFNKSFETVISL